MFLEQLYDLHRAIAIQKLLMQNCPEVQQASCRRPAACLLWAEAACVAKPLPHGVQSCCGASTRTSGHLAASQPAALAHRFTSLTSRCLCLPLQVMGEAMRLMSSVGSQHGSGSGRGSKRQRTTPNGGATVPGSGSGDPSSFRPDSQFAAVPQLPGEAQTRDDEDDDGGSGDANGSGSAGANGSGGGSTSPQQVVPGMPPPPPLPYMYLAHTAVATPSGASAAPGGWQWPLVQGQVQQMQQVGLPPVPRGPPQMAPWVGQDAGLAAVGLNTHTPQHLKRAAGAAGGKQPSKTATAATAPPAPKAAAAPPPAAPARPAAAAPAAPGPPAPQPKQPQPAAQHPQPQLHQVAPAVAQPSLPPGIPLPPPASLAMPPPGMPPPMPFGPPPPVMMHPPGRPGLSCPAPGAADPMSWWYQTYYGNQQQVGRAR